MRKYLYILLASCFFLPFAFASEMFLSGAGGNIYRDCYQPFDVRINLNGSETLAVDTKFILSGDFIINTGATVFFQNGDMDVTNYLGTGYSLTSGDTYHYFNTYQNTTALTGNDRLITTVYLNPITPAASANIDFYFIPDEAYDDSNISEGYNPSSDGYTQIRDSLTGVTNGSYTVIDDYACPFRPYIQTGVYRQRSYISTGNGQVEKVWTGVPAGPAYTATQPTDWLVRTKEAIDLILTGNEIIVLETGWISGIPEVTLNTTATRSTGYDFTISGNTANNNLQFVNTISNTGHTYSTGGTNYDYTGFIDVFWYDTTLTPISGEIIGNFVYLTGQTGGTADRTDKDDEIKIIAFSGAIPAPTNYLTGAQNSGFSLYHGPIIFDRARSGNAIYTDRAGNTGTYFIEIIDVDYIVIAYPQTRAATYNNLNYATTGFVSIYEGYTLVGNEHQGTNLITTGVVRTNENGTGNLTINYLLSGSYFMTFQGISSLRQDLTSITLTSTDNVIDFSSGAARVAGGFVDGDAIVYTMEYTAASAGSESITLGGLGYNFNTSFSTDSALILSNQAGVMGTNYTRSAASVSAGSNTLVRRGEILGADNLIVDDFAFGVGGNITVNQTGASISNQLIAGDMAYPAGTWEGYDNCIGLPDIGRILDDYRNNRTNTDGYETDLNNDTYTNAADIAFFLSNIDRGQNCAGDQKLY